MIRLAATRSFRFTLALAVTFSLIYGPVYYLNPVRAESYSPTNPSRNVQQITKAHKRGEVIIKFRDDAPKHLRDWVVATYAKGEKILRGRGRESKLTIKDGFDLANTAPDRQTACRSIYLARGQNRIDAESLEQTFNLDCR